MNQARRRLWTLRLLGLAAPLVGLLWVAGIARFRGYELTAGEWSAVVLAAFAMHLVVGRRGARRALPALPEGYNLVAVATLAAALLAVLTGVLGALFEWLVDQYQPSEYSLAARALWHAACAFGGAYCTFVHRLQQRPRSP